MPLWGISSRFGIGTYINLLKLEADETKGTIKKTNDSFTYDFKNKNETLVVKVKIYKNTWRLVVKTDGYRSKHLGVINQIKASFMNGEKLLLFLKECTQRYNNEVTELKNISTCADVLKKVIIEIKELVNLNAMCILPEPCLDDFYNILYGYKNTKFDCNMILLIDFFKYLLEHKTDSIFYFLALYVVSKNFFNLKYAYATEGDYKAVDSFEISAESQSFAYAHMLQFYEGKCKWLHGHNGKIKIKASFTKNVLESRPMFLSYGFLKKFLRSINDELDHKTYIPLNEKYPCTFISNNLRVTSPKQDIIFYDKNAYVLIPRFLNISNFSTSEIMLNNFVIPYFLVYLLTCHIKESGPDFKQETFLGIEEYAKFKFCWYETNSTVCSMSTNC